MRTSKQRRFGFVLALPFIALAAAALSVSTVSAGQGRGNLQLVDDDNYSSHTELVATAEDNMGLKSYVEEIASVRISIEPGTKTGDLDPTGMKILNGDLDPDGNDKTGDGGFTLEIAALTEIGGGSASMSTDDNYLVNGGEIASMTGDDNYQWLDGKGETLIASADSSANASPDGLIEGLLSGGGMTTYGLVGADGTSLAWSADLYTV